MRRWLAKIVISLVAILLLAPSFGCANAGGSSGSHDGYYRRGSTHRNSFPGAYSGGGYYGRYGRYGRY